MYKLIHCTDRRWYFPGTWEGRWKRQQDEEGKKNPTKQPKNPNYKPPPQTQQRSNLLSPLKSCFRRPNISQKADAGNAPAQQETINICPKSHTSCDYLHKHKVNGISLLTGTHRYAGSTCFTSVSGAAG